MLTLLTLRGGSPEASKPSCCRREERKRRESEPGGRTGAGPGGGGREAVPSDLWVGAAGTPARRKRKVGVATAGRRGRERARGRARAAGRILGRWRSAGTGPCRVCGTGAGWRGSRSLQERKKWFLFEFGALLKTGRFGGFSKLTGGLVMSCFVRRVGLLVVQLGRLRRVG